MNSSVEHTQNRKMKEEHQNDSNTAKQNSMENDMDDMDKEE